MSLRAVIFDFDGLILDTEMPEFVSWCEVFETRGQVLDQTVWSRGVGTRDGFDPYLHLETLSGVIIDRGMIRAEVRARNEALLEELVLLDGVEARLDEARELGLKIGLASSADRSWIDRHLDRFGLTSRFDAIRCTSDGLVAKPDPALYQAALRELGCEASEAVAFEDSPNGIAAAKAAGMMCIAVPNSITSVLDLSAADAIVASLAGVSLRKLSETWGSGLVV